MCIEEDVGVKDLEANMKKILIRLTGLIVTLSIVLSTGGMAMATETEGQDNGTGVAATEPAEIPDTAEPAPVKEEEPAAAEEPAAEKPAEEKPAANEPAEEPAKEEEPAAKGPAAPAKDDAPAGEPKDQDAEEKAPTESKSFKFKLDKSNDELAEEYINRAFGKTSVRKRSIDYTAQLDDTGRIFYNYLLTEFTKIASGERSSTILIIQICILKKKISGFQVRAVGVTFGMLHVPVLIMPLPLRSMHCFNHALMNYIGMIKPRIVNWDIAAPTPVRTQ